MNTCTPYSLPVHRVRVGGGDGKENREGARMFICTCLWNIESYLFLGGEFTRVPSYVIGLETANCIVEKEVMKCFLCRFITRKQTFHFFLSLFVFSLTLIVCVRKRQLRVESSLSWTLSRSSITSIRYLKNGEILRALSSVSVCLQFNLYFSRWEGHNLCLNRQDSSGRKGVLAEDFYEHVFIALLCIHK